ncbi:hypothetical protein HOY80DRAFT_1083758 [Tuber brumale]|nr:hypothetical protein HOY80DRAFT_1083758 [Tuber brumale]
MDFLYQGAGYWKATRTSRAIDLLSQPIYDLPYPTVAKPARGRGSEGVELIDGFVGMLDTLDDLFKTFNVIEEFLEGEDGTMTIVPDGQGNGGHHHAHNLIILPGHGNLSFISVLEWHPQGYSTLCMASVPLPPELSDFITPDWMRIPF